MGGTNQNPEKDQRIQREENIPKPRTQNQRILKPRRILKQQRTLKPPKDPQVTKNPKDPKEQQTQSLPLNTTQESDIEPVELPFQLLRPNMVSQFLLHQHSQIEDNPKRRPIHIATGSPMMASVDHLHMEVEMLTVREHLEMLCCQFLATCLQPSHPSYPILLGMMGVTLPPTESYPATQPPHIDASENSLPRAHRTLLSQLHSGRALLSSHTGRGLAWRTAQTAPPVTLPEMGSI